jgi:hypothetical protein
MGLRAALPRDGAAMLQTLLNEQAGRQQPSVSPWQKCYRARPKVVETLFGPITLYRDYFGAAATRIGRSPLDEQLGLLEGYSPGLAKIMCRIGAQQCFELAASDLRAYAGVQVESRAIVRMTQLIAPEMEKARANRDCPTPCPTVPMMYIQADGTGVPVRKSETLGRKAKQGDQAKTREVKLGCVFTQHVVDAQGHPLRDESSTTYLASFCTADAFGLLLRQEAFRRGMAGAQQTIFMGDGAAWVWELARINFPDAICILDFYHAAEHLGALADAIYGAHSPRAASCWRRWCSLLKSQRLDTILRQAHRAMPVDPTNRQLAEKEIAYLQNNRSRMAYASFQSKGYFIVSGVVEAECKTVVGNRLKNSGMFWSLKGAQNVLTLRTALLGNHFDHDWDQRIALHA